MAFRSLAVFALGTRVLLLDAKETKPKSCIKFDPNEGCHLLEEHQSLPAAGREELSMIQRVRSKKRPNAGLDVLLQGRSGRVSPPQVITMGGFVIDSFLNGQYTERSEEYMVAGQKTFWSTNGYFLYWCDGFDYWAIGYPAAWQHVKEADGMWCGYTATGPAGERTLNASLSTGWSEWDQESGALVPSSAGVQSVGTEEVLAASPDTIEDPGTLQTITMGGFVTNGVLNQRYVERPGGSYAVAGERTFWSSDGYYLYWCEWKKYWAIGFPSSWAKVKDGDGWYCSYTATGPEGERALNSSSLSRGWSEWDQEAGSLVFRVAAGVQIASTASGLGAGSGSFHIAESMGEACARQMLQLGARDQGTCSNCWANAVAQTLQSLLCDKVRTDFQGLRASVSVAYITSCASDAFAGKDGCSGGDPLKALIWIGSNGVPTGGDFGCVQPLDMNATPTQCPTSCSNEFYDRSLQEDLFVPAGLKNSWMTVASENAKLWLHKGPVLIRFRVYSDFYDYTGGLYSPAEDAGEFEFYHICAAIAYGKDYFTAYNSWGVGSWGQGGLFNISADAIDTFIIPGEISGSATDYPLPLPPVEVADYVVMAGFETDLLNGKYIEGGAATVSGHPIFWNHHGAHGFPSPPNATVLFWCPSTGSWAIAWASHYPDELRIGRCHWLARGPALDSSAALASQPQVGGDWLESSAGGGSRGRVEALG